MSVYVKVFIATIVLTFVADFLFFPGTVFGNIVILLSGVILFIALLKNRFRLERCNEEEQGNSAPSLKK